MYLKVSSVRPCEKKSSLDISRYTILVSLERELASGSLRRDLDSLPQSINVILLMLFDILQELGVGGRHIVGYDL